MGEPPTTANNRVQDGNRVGGHLVEEHRERRMTTSDLGLTAPPSTEERRGDASSSFATARPDRAEQGPWYKDSRVIVGIVGLMLFSPVGLVLLYRAARSRRTERGEAAGEPSTSTKTRNRVIGVVIIIVLALVVASIITSTQKPKLAAAPASATSCAVVMTGSQGVITAYLPDVHTSTACGDAYTVMVRNAGAKGVSADYDYVPIGTPFCSIRDNIFGTINIYSTMTSTETQPVCNVGS
jgi:hypothetical protein